jgi:hypothetical protein
VQPAPADVPAPHARIAELERELAETRAQAGRDTASVGAGGSSRDSGNEASS